MKTIFQPFTIKELTIPNRIVMAPMCMYSAKEDGLATMWHHIHYTTRAVGSVGLIIIEATAVREEGRISDRDLGLWNDAQRDQLKTIVDSVHAQGAKIGIQLAHAGRKSGSAVLPHYGISGDAFSDDYIQPDKLQEDDYPMIVEAFQASARRAYEAGFDLIELHAAHGYLLSEAISPLPRPNLDLSERITLLNQVIVAVRQVWPHEKPLQMRLSATDYVPEGLSEEELLQLVQHLKNLDVDIINVSSGGVINVPIKAFPGYQVRFSDLIRNECSIPTIAGGLITSGDMITEILDNQRADLVYLGRELLRHPYFVHELARRFNEPSFIPKAYERG